ncbi:MAG: hypothetical protein K6F46_08070 [Desulfovibrio sp.]|nr:hypothetical protein [Desulfovibrio sp.]
MGIIDASKFSVSSFVANKWQMLPVVVDNYLAAFGSTAENDGRILQTSGLA